MSKDQTLGDAFGPGCCHRKGHAMNPLIEKLAREALDCWQPIGGARTWYALDEHVEAFARAVAERAAQICENESEGHRMAFGEHCAAIIRKEFGLLAGAGGEGSHV